MLSHDLDNLARALEQVACEFPEEKASFLTLVCNNLHSLAQQAEILESIPMVREMDVIKAVPRLQ